MGEFDYMYERGLVDKSGMPTWTEDEDNNFYSREKINIKKPYYTSINYDGRVERHINVSLTPKKYLNESEKKAREFIMGPRMDNYELEILHEKSNQNDSRAIKILFNGTKIGYIEKYSSQFDVDSFCFENERLLDNLSIYYHDIENNLILTKIDLTEKTILDSEKTINIIRDIYENKELYLDEYQIKEIQHLFYKTDKIIEDESRVIDFIKNYFKNNLDKLNDLELDYNSIKKSTLKFNFDDENFKYSFSSNSLDISNYDFRNTSNKISLLSDIKKLNIHNCMNIEKFILNDNLIKTIKSVNINGKYNTYPTWIENLSNIEELSLRNCIFENINILPKEICNLEYLEILDLGGLCSIIKLPSDIQFLNKLHCIKLNNNNIEIQDLPIEITTIESLETIYYDNKIPNIKEKLKNKFLTCNFTSDIGFEYSIGEEYFCTIDNSIKNEKKSFFSKLFG